MSPLPVDNAARRRLLEAQRAEADALRAIELAARAHDRVVRKLKDARDLLDRAKIELVRTSGVPRSAILLDVQESELRRLVRANDRRERTSDKSL